MQQKTITVVIDDNMPIPSPAQSGITVVATAGGWQARSSRCKAGVLARTEFKLQLAP